MLQQSLQEVVNTPKVSLQTFGVSKSAGPNVVVFHALTGNAQVAGENGWWKELFGEQKLFDTDRFHVVGVNLPGNGQQGDEILDYRAYTARDIADAVVRALQESGYDRIDIAIGGSLGGGILWEIVVNHPFWVKKAIVIAAHWRSDDWVKGMTHTQDLLLQSEDSGLELARQMAMFFYRNPKDFKIKFNEEVDPKNSERKVVNWLNFHGERLSERFSVQAYRMMNQLLGSIDAIKSFSSLESAFERIRAEVVQVGITSDGLFTLENNKKTKEILDQLGVRNSLEIIDSPHGHDAFLIEYEKLTKQLKKYIV